MSSNSEVFKNPWAAIAAGVVVVAIVGMQYLTLTALVAQSEATAQMIDAANSSRSMEITGLRTRQQIILAEVRQLNETAANAHQAAEAAAAATAAAAAAPTEEE